MNLIDLKRVALQKMGSQPDNLALELLLGKALGMTREKLFLNENEQMHDDQIGEFMSLFEQFLGGKPVAQILGNKEFYGLEFQVDVNVLIPRPETEMVVDLAREYIKSHLAERDEVKILDVGSGSGCIIETLVKVESKVKGFGFEISEKAIAVALKNAKNLGISDRVEFRHSDLLGALGDLPDQRFDLIVSNLPYIGTQRFNFVARDVEKFEPAVALFGGLDGLDLYRKMFGQLVGLAWRPACLIGEFGFGQEEDMQNILEQYFSSMAEYSIIPDLAGIPRIFVVDFRSR